MNNGLTKNKSLGGSYILTARVIQFDEDLSTPVCTRPEDIRPTTPA